MKRVYSTASERGRNTLKGVEALYLKDRARIWAWQSCMWRVEWAALEQHLDEARASHAKHLSEIVALFSQQLAAPSGNRRLIRPPYPPNSRPIHPHATLSIQLPP